MLYTHVQNIVLNKMMYNMLRFVIMKILFFWSTKGMPVFFCIVTQHLTSRHIYRLNSLIYRFVLASKQSKVNINKGWWGFFSFTQQEWLKKGDVLQKTEYAYFIISRWLWTSNRRRNYCNGRKYFRKQVWANTVDPDQRTVEIWSGSALFASSPASFGHITMGCRFTFYSLFMDIQKFP